MHYNAKKNRKKQPNVTTPVAFTLLFNRYIKKVHKQINKCLLDLMSGPQMIDSHGSSISSWFLRKKTCIVAIVPVSVPLSSLIIEGIILASYKYSKYQWPIILGSLLAAVSDPDPQP